MMPIKGEVESVLRDETHTEVVVVEGTMQVAYELDQTQIEFGTAIDDRDFGRAIDYLLQQGDSRSSSTVNDVDTMWRQLASVGVEQNNLPVMQRAYAAVGDVARLDYIADTMQLARVAARQIGGDGMQYYRVRARMAIMRKEFRDAERIYLEQVSRVFSHHLCIFPIECTRRSNRDVSKFAQMGRSIGVGGSESEWLYFCVLFLICRIIPTSNR